MPPINRTTKIQNLHKVIKKQSPKPTKHPERSVLEHLVYAACLENASFEQTDKAFLILQQEFVDWNEVRVSAPAELAEVLPHLPEPLAAGERVKRALQGVFENKYTFDLEDLNKKPQAQITQFFDTFPSVTNFMVDYLIQVVLGSHVIPLDEAALRIFRLLGLTQLTSDQTREIVPSLERVIAKGEGVAFAIMLHQIAAQFYDKPDSAALRQLLKSIDAEVKNRSWAPPTLAPDKRELLRQQRRERARLDMRQFAEQFEEESPDESRVTMGEVEFIPNELIDGSEPNAKKGVPEKVKPAKGKPLRIKLATVKAEMAKLKKEKAEKAKLERAAAKAEKAKLKKEKKEAALQEKAKKTAEKLAKVKVKVATKLKEKAAGKSSVKPTPKSPSKKVLAKKEKKEKKSVASKVTSKKSATKTKPTAKKTTKKTASAKTTKKSQKKAAGKSPLVPKTSKPVSKTASSTTKLRHKKPR